VTLQLPMLLAASAAASLSMSASDVRIETRVDSRIRVTVAAIYDSLDREGITGEPLVQYALEGTEKRGTPEVILAGVRRWAKDLRRSRRILGAGATPSEISSGARALRAGLSEKQLQGMREARVARSALVHSLEVSRRNLVHARARPMALMS